MQITATMNCIALARRARYDRSLPPDALSIAVVRGLRCESPMSCCAC
jgi:hypothetical protein